MNGECLEGGLYLITLLCFVLLLSLHPRVEESHSVDITVQRLEWLGRGPVLCVAAGTHSDGLGDGLFRDPAAAGTKIGLGLLLHIALLDRTPGLQDPRTQPDSGPAINLKTSVPGRAAQPGGRNATS